ncbi:hypothetical protein [Hyphococcus sp.]|uniref:hypothetical protein n=1 Tax=Hyphococcus sp. TaxID=2038636 RepID=UPI003D0C3DCD
MLTYPGLVKFNSRGEVIPTQTISCAEPSPDVFSVYAASGEAAFSKGDVGGSGSFATVETGASLLERTTALQALRDNYFRLCEGFAIGAIDEIDFMIGQRHNQTALIGLIAIEEMKAASRPPAVVIGGSATASSASGVMMLSKQMTDEMVAQAELEESLKGNKDKIKTKESEIEKTKPVAEQTLPANPTPEQTAAVNEAKAKLKSLESELTALQTEGRDLSAKIEAKKKVVAALAAAIEKGGVTGAAASSIVQEIVQAERPQCDSACATQKEAIAKQMTKVVQLIDDNDFGPTICLSYLRKQTPVGIPTSALMDEYEIPSETNSVTTSSALTSANTRRTQAERQESTTTEITTRNYKERSIMAEVCEDVMEEYVAGLRERRTMARILVQALAESGETISAENIGAISQILDGGDVQIFQGPVMRMDGPAVEGADDGAVVDLDMMLEGKARLSAPQPDG